MSTIKRHGLTLRRTARATDGFTVTSGWVADDLPGVEIERAWGSEMCANAHPHTWRNHETGKVTREHCAGGQTHDRVIGWDIRPTPTGMDDNLYETLDEAVAALATYLSTRA